MTLTNTTKACILLVEDTEDDAYFFKRRLEKSGLDCTLHRVGNGAQAVAFLQKAAASQPEAFPQIIFLDLKMPIMNGFDVLEWLRGQPFGAQMPVVILSGSEHQNDRERAAQLGATDYLVKPITAGDLDRLLRDVCPSKTAMGAHV